MAAQKSKARPSKQVLDLIVHGRGVVAVTLGGQPRLWTAYRLPSHMVPEGQIAWEVKLVGGWPEETLATFDVFRDIRTGHISCLAEGWQERMTA